MSIAGNQYFTGVSKTATSKSALANTLTEYTHFDQILTHSAAGVLTVGELIQARDGGLLVDITAANDLQLGPDTAANALALATALGLSKTGQSCFLKFITTAPTDAAADVDLANTSGTHVFVNVALAGTDADTQVLAVATPAGGALGGPVANVLATFTSAVSGAEVITFSILNQMIANA